MENGLKIKSGEDIGKTIIFAYNHKHAERIVERFHALFPNRGADYCQLIDNQVNYHDKLIAKFKVAESMPQIAVSVDMLDTGIDVPEVLNLVFFKIVKSKIKFEQMIGRGTRLCPDIFGEGKDKECFYIFDWCGNFDYFSKKPDGIDASNSKSLTERLFSLRLDIAKELQSAEHQEKAFDKQMHDELKVLLHQQVNGIVKERKDARPYWNIIEPFRDKEKWTYLSEVDVSRLKEIGKLIPQDDDDESAKKFDVIMLHLQLAHIDSTVRVGQFRQVVVNVAAHLEKKGSIPAVMRHIDTIRQVQQPPFWANESLDSLERYEMLRRIGADEKDITKSLLHQQGIFFLIPMLLAVFHSIFGIKFINKSLVIFGQYHILGSIIFTSLIIGLIYGGYFVITYSCSRQIIRGRR